jgi:hypothetical protein
MMNNYVSDTSKRLPFIPKQSREFKPMRYRLCESEFCEKQVHRSAFMRQLEQQPHPMGQIYIDFDDGIAYLFPYDPERAERFAAAYRKFETEYKRFKREQKAIREKRRMTVLHLGLLNDSETDGDEMQSTWLFSEETPESEYLAREDFVIHRESFNALTDSDRDILTSFMNAGYNASELARRLGKDHSGVLKRVKRAAARLQKIIEENS